MSCCAAPCPGLLSHGMCQVGRGERGRCTKSRRAGSWRRSDLLEVLLHCSLRLSETVRAVGVCERDPGGIDAMGLAIGPLRQPTVEARGKAIIVSNESADATDG